MPEVFRSIILALVLLVPGYVWHVVESLFVYHDQQIQWEKFALKLLTRSTFIGIFFADAIYKAWWQGLDSVHFGVVAFEMLFFVPITAGFFCGFLRQKKWVTTLLAKCNFKIFDLNRPPTAWRALFSKPLQNWVIVTLKSGAQIYGYMGESSIMSSHHQDRDLYISHVLKSDGNGGWKFVEDTNGIYVASNEISTIEFIKEIQEPYEKIGQDQ